MPNVSEVPETRALLNRGRIPIVRNDKHLGTCPDVGAVSEQWASSRTRRDLKTMKAKVDEAPSPVCWLALRLLSHCGMMRFGLHTSATAQSCEDCELKDQVEESSRPLLVLH